MAYIPQYIDSRGNRALIASYQPGYSGWKIVNPGTGYLPTDVGQQLYLNYTYSQPDDTAAHCTITQVTGGGITGVAESIGSGAYFHGLTNTIATTGGSGTGCTVMVLGDYCALYTEDVGFGPSFSQLTVYINCYDYVFVPSFWMEGYAGGFKLQFTGQCSLYNGDEHLWLQFMDDSGAVMFDGYFIRSIPLTTVLPVQKGFWDILICLDTSSQTLHLFINDEEWVLDYTIGRYAPDYSTLKPRSAGWTAGNYNPIANPYGVMPGWKLQGVGGGFASVYMSPTYTDMTIPANRRVFTTVNNVGSDGTWIDPATFPPAPVNLYLRQGDQPSDMVNNHGTAMVPWKLTSPNIPFMFFMAYWTSAFGKTHENTPSTAHVPGGTVRPGATIYVKPNGSGVSNGTLTVSGEYYTYTPTPNFVGFGDVYFSLGESMPAGYVQPDFPSGSIGVGSPYSVDGPIIPEARRRSWALRTLPYKGGFQDIQDFLFPARFYDRALVMVRSDESDFSNPYFSDHSALTFQELGPESSIYTNFGTEPPDYQWAEVDYWDWGIWNNRIFGFQADPWDDVYAYYYLEYNPGTTSDPPVYITGVWSLDLPGFTSQSYWDFQFPLCWQGLTNAFICAINPNADNPNAWDAFVISDQGHQVIPALFTLPATSPNSPWEPDPAALIPDHENNCNWLILFNNDVHTAQSAGIDSGWSLAYGQCFGADGSFISEQYYQFEASDVCSNLLFGLVSWGSGNNSYQLSATTDYFRIYCGMGWWGDQSDERTEYPRGNCVVSIAKDFSSYTVDFIVPKEDDSEAFGELNKMIPWGYIIHDREGSPYYMSWGNSQADFAPILSVDHAYLQLVTLYPFDDPTSDYAFTAGSDFDTNFTQFSISMWCCKDVHIQSPEQPQFLSAVSMDFSPSRIVIALYGVDGSLRFSGTWLVAVPKIEYQVLFSIDSMAQTYSLYVNDTVPFGSPTWGDPGTIGWA